MLCKIKNNVIGSTVRILVEKGCAVMSSHCVSMVLNKKVQLNRSLTFPLESLVMIDTFICFSNIKPKIRVSIKICNKIKKLYNKL